MISSLQYYDCNEITGADLHTVYEEVTDADDEGSGSYSCPDLETSFGSLSSYEEVTDADAYLVCARSGLSSCGPDNASPQKKRAFSKVTLTRDRKRLKPIDGEVECLLLDGELSCSGDYNNVVII